MGKTEKKRGQCKTTNVLASYLFQGNWMNVKVDNTGVKRQGTVAITNGSLFCAFCGRPCEN